MPPPNFTMITRSRSKNTRQHTPLTPAASSKTAKGATELHSRCHTDPFQILDDVCIRAIFLLLAPVDIVRCDAVSRLWRATVGFNLTGYVIRRDSPYAMETGRFAGFESDEERVREFKRMVYEDKALQHGNATWVYYFPCAQVSSIAGNYVVWHQHGLSYLHWQALTGAGESGRQAGESKVLYLSKLVQTAGPIKVESLHVNEDGYLHVMVWVRDSLYLYGQKRTNIVFSLRDDKVMWDNTLNRTKYPMTPIQIGSSLVYCIATIRTKAQTNAGSSLLDSATALAACELKRGKVVYTNHYLDDSPTSMEKKDFKLLYLMGKEYIIHIGSHKHRYTTHSGEQKQEFTIIEGATGNVIQRVRYDGCHGNSVFAKPSTATFALWTPPHNIGFFAFPTYGVIHIYTRKADGTFSRDTSIAVRNPTFPNYTVHPFTLRGFRVHPAAEVHTLTLVDDTKEVVFGQPNPAKDAIERHKSVVLMALVTLPPKVGEGKTRRMCKVKLRERVDFGNVTVMGADGTRMVYFDGYDRGTLYVFDFAAPW
ncbi:MAG: hypothetical protein M1839_003531 [Geoglossum umbratile]|nr:MAG: hypothetical protein M1839_003531 [Geoglossum umbratile]